MIFLFLLMACEKIVLKRGESLPYKIESGRYRFNIYELSYPETTEQKEEFLRRFEELMIPFIAEGRKMMLMISEEFMKDQIFIERHGVLPDEVFLKKAASQLDDNEMAKLSPDRKKMQDLLNLQVLHILKLLNRADEFQDGRLYTELFKERLLEDLAHVRIRVLSILKSKFINLFVKLTHSGEERKPDLEYRKHYYVKEIIPHNKGKLAFALAEYKNRAMIALTMDEVEAERLITSEARINLKEYLVINERFQGYVVNDSIIHFVGGEERLQANADYDISLRIKNINVEELSSIDEEYILTDLYKSKKQIAEAKENFLKAVQKIKESREVSIPTQ